MALTVIIPGILAWGFSYSYELSLSSLIILTLFALICFGVILITVTQPQFGLYFLCFVMPFEYFQPLSLLNFVKIIGWLVGFSWIIRKLTVGMKIRFPKSFRLLLIFALWAIVSISWAADKGKAFLKITTLLQVLIFYLFIVDSIRSEKILWNALLAISLGTIVASLWAIIITLERGSTRLLFIAEVSPNYFTGYAAFVIGWSLAFLFGKSSILNLVAAIALMALGILPVLFSGTIAGSLAIIAGMVIALWIDFQVLRRKKSVIKLGVFLAFLVFIIEFILVDTGWLDRLILAYQGPKFRESRGVLWAAMFYRWLERPLWGWGWGMSFDASGLSRTINSLGLADPLGYAFRETTAPHNALLWAAVEMGIIGLMLLVAVYLIHFRHLLVVIRWSITQNLISSQISVALTVIAVIVFTISLTEDVVLKRFFWLLLALIESEWMLKGCLIPPQIRFAYRRGFSMRSNAINDSVPSAFSAASLCSELKKRN